MTSTRHRAVVATVALLAGLVGCGTADQPAAPVAEVIADPALAACVTTALDLPTPAGATASPTPTEADYAAVTELHCDGMNSAAGPIGSLEGIQRLTGLQNLDAPGNAITDLGPLADLPRLGTR